MKKQQKLEGNRLTFFQMGAIISLVLSLAAFEWESPTDVITFSKLPMIIDPIQAPISLKLPEKQAEKPKINYMTNIIDVPDNKKTVDYITPGADAPIIDSLDGVSLEPETNSGPEPPFISVEIMPEFTGGEKARIKYLRDNVRYPSEALRSGVQGRVYISFIVEADGSVSNVNLLRGIGFGCDEEALRVLSAMPRWKPGIQSGKTVRVLYNTDIKFTLAQ